MYGVPVVLGIAHLSDEADEVGAVSPGDRRLPPTLDAGTAVVVVVALTAAELATPRVQLVGLQLGSESLDEHVHGVDDQSRLQLHHITHNTQNATSPVLIHRVCGVFSDDMRTVVKLYALHTDTVVLPARQTNTSA